ncbi:MAG: 4-hydroxy-tetrahydrodipicolinate reductase [Rhodothermaceae bacterium]|nr:MAG: 4-hydroxy-tetrahydrodipicolinate reductase [Rhodothermaceae bacterium]
MRLALIGTGQMGATVEALARARGDEVVARFNRGHPLDADGAEALARADVAIDFSRAEVVPCHVTWCCRKGVPLVIGTTGWYDALETVRATVAAHDGAVLYAANFSMGVALLMQALRGLVPLLERLPGYDVQVHEVHHVRKADHPSGTARALAQVLLDGLSRKTHLATDLPDGPLDPAALQVTAARVGRVFGLHTVTLDGEHDRLTFTHEARSRQGFAEGALTAAAWLRSRRGLFTLDDLLADWWAHPGHDSTTTHNAE